MDYKINFVALGNGEFAHSSKEGCIASLKTRVSQLESEVSGLKANLKYISYRFKAYTLYFDGTPDIRSYVSGSLSAPAAKYGLVSLLEELGYTRGKKFDRVKIKRVRKYDDMVQKLAYEMLLSNRPSDVVGVDSTKTEDEDLWKNE